MFDLEFEIPVENLEAIKARVKEVNKKAAKLGVDGVTLTVGDTVAMTVAHQTGLEFGEVYVNVTISGQTPKFDGWTFIATLELSDAGSLVRTMPGMDCPPEHRDRGNVCDHCGKSRQRTNTYVIVHDDGRTKSVGRNCLKDFMGAGRLNPVNIANHFKWLLDSSGDEGGFGGFRHGVPTYDISSVLELTGATISAYGWVSGGMVKEGKHGGPATSENVRMFLNHNPDKSTEWEREMVQEIRHQWDVTKERRVADAQAALEWLLSPDQLPVTGDYIHNIRVLAQRGWVTKKDFGFACSILNSWRNAMHRQAETQRREEGNKKAAAESQHVGTIGERQEFSLKITRLMELPSDFGVKVLHFMEDAEGNRLKWFSSGGALGEESDAFVTVKATVKKHDEYKGIKETILNRVMEVANAS